MKRTTPAASALASSPSADGGAREAGRRQLQDADRRRVALQHGEQVSAGLDAILQLDRGDRIEHRLLERRGGARERADPLGVGGQRLRLGGGFGRAGVVARDEAEHGSRRARPRAGRRRPAARAGDGWPAAGRGARGRPLRSGVEEARSVALSWAAMGLAQLERARRAGRRGTGRRAPGRPRPTARAASPSCRCTRMPARSSSSQRRSGGHSRISASWATSAEPVVERHQARVGEPLAAAPRRLRAAAPSGTSSSTATRRRESSLPSPSSVMPQEHAAHQLALLGAAAHRRRPSAVRAMAEATPPVSR